MSGQSTIFLLARAPKTSKCLKHFQTSTLTDNLLAVTLAENLSQLLVQLLSSTLDTVLILVKLRVQRLFKSSVVTFNVMFIPFMSCLALVTMLWYSAIYENDGLNDNHFLLLVSSKHWPQLSTSNSLTNYLFGPKS